MVGDETRVYISFTALYVHNMNTSYDCTVIYRW